MEGKGGKTTQGGARGWSIWTLGGREAPEAKKEESDPSIWQKGKSKEKHRLTTPELKASFEVGSLLPKRQRGEKEIPFSRSEIGGGGKRE